MFCINFMMLTVEYMRRAPIYLFNNRGPCMHAHQFRKRQTKVSIVKLCCSLVGDTIYLG